MAEGRKNSLCARHHYNGFDSSIFAHSSLERFHQTIQNEFYATAFRKKVYANIEELQGDVEKWMKEYNEDRPHTGKYCYGKTPWQTFQESKHLAQAKMLDEIDLTEEVVR